MATKEAVRPSLYKYARDQETFLTMADVIRQNVAVFNKPGVVSVRPGYKAVGGWLTQKPAIVVNVEQKIETPTAEQALPGTVGGFAVDVRQAGPLEKLRAGDPRHYADLIAGSRREFALPEFAGEVTPAGTPVTSFDAGALVARAGAPQIEYSAPPDATLDAVEEPMAITCHASPDAGWGELKAFLGELRSKLVVGMYDFTSQHVLDALSGDLEAQKAALELVLDHPTKNPTADLTDEETVKDLADALGVDFNSAWALVRSSPKAPQWIYPTAYHIKVAVRDGTAFWLSSGNWNNSNQPDIDPLHDQSPDTIATAKKSDRDWHVIVEHAGLAKTYQAFLQHDYDVAHDVESGPAPEAFVPPMAMAPELAAGIGDELAMAPRNFARFFPPVRIPEAGITTIKIQPILTPDNYHEHVLALIQSAERSFYMQTQYIHPSEAPDDGDFADLINAVVELQQRGVDVRIILSQWQVQGKGGWLEKLQQAGVDLSSVRIQNGVHNKGIVVDSKVVMLGSQNWSGDGTIRNRDASVIIHHEDAARYYEQIFMHDWTHLARQSAPM